MCRLNNVSAANMLAIVAILCISTIADATEFTKPTVYHVGGAPNMVVAGDFNGDGKMDLATVNSGSGDVSVLLGNGDGTFQAAKNFNVGGTPTSLAVGDFNGDQKLDLAVGSGTNVIVLLGKGDGTFDSPTQINVGASRLIAADVNQDSKIDLVTENGLLLGNGDGTFRPAMSLDGAAPLLVADFNNDGKPDVLTSENVLLGNGDGTFQAPKPLPGPGCGTGVSCKYVLSSRAMDFNNDQKLDVAIAISISKLFVQPKGIYLIDILFGQGDGTFQSPMQINASAESVASADFNGDGKPDLAIMPGIYQGSPLVYLQLGRGDGTFPSTFSFDTGAGPNFLLAADLNGDKLPDLIATDPGDNTVTVMLNMSPTTGADLSVQISATPEPVSVTQQLTYTVQAINSGPADATNVTLKNTLPSGVSLVSANISQSGCTQANLVVTCTLSKFVSGDSATLKMVVVPSAAGTATDAADISGTESDSLIGNNNATHSTHVDPMFTLAVTKTGAGTGAVSDNANNLGSFGCGDTCTASLPTGTHVSIVANADSGSVFGGWEQACGSSGLANECDLTMNANQNVTASFDKGPNFFLSADASSLTVARGRSVITNITIIPEAGPAGSSFNSAIELSCSVTGPAPMPSCSLSSTSVLPGNNQTGIILKITAPIQSTALEWVKPLRSSNAAPRTSLLVAVLFLIGLVRAFTRTMPRKRTLCLLSCFFVTVTVLVIGCGGGSGRAIPQPQSYNITVTANSGAITKSTQISLTVK